MYRYKYFVWDVFSIRESDTLKNANIWAQKERFFVHLSFELILSVQLK
jgi:hypothetical protein